MNGFQCVSDGSKLMLCDQPPLESEGYRGTGSVSDPCMRCTTVECRFYLKLVLQKMYSFINRTGDLATDRLNLFSLCGGLAFMPVSHLLSYKGISLLD